MSNVNVNDQVNADFFLQQRSLRWIFYRIKKYGQKNGSSNLCRENSIPDTAMRGVVRAFLVVAIGLCSVAEAIPAKRSRHLQGEVSSCRLICARRSRRAKENLSSQKQTVLSHLDLKCVSEYGSGDLHDGRLFSSSHRHPPSLTLPA